jgi:hypothetical protein
MRALQVVTERGNFKRTYSKINFQFTDDPMKPGHNSGNPGGAHSHSKGGTYARSLTAGSRHTRGPAGLRALARKPETVSEPYPPTPLRIPVLTQVWPSRGPWCGPDWEHIERKFEPDVMAVLLSIQAWSHLDLWEKGNSHLCGTLVFLGEG